MTHRGGGGKRAVGQTLAPGKKRGSQLACGAGQGAAEIVLRMGMLARKAGATDREDGRDARGGCALAEQFLGDPFVGDAPVRLREALGDAQSLQPIPVDAGCVAGDRRGSGLVAVFLVGRRVWVRRRAMRRAAAAALGGLQQSGALWGQACVGVAELHPGSIAAGPRRRGFWADPALPVA